MNQHIKVAILDFRNVIAQGSEEVIARHEKYASALKQVSDCEQCKLIIFSPCPSKLITRIDSNALILQSTGTSNWNIVSYAFQVWKLLRDQTDNSILLVAGDPWESAIAAYLVKFLLRKSPPIQVQVHGDIGDKNWINSSLVNKLRKILARLTLHFATEIRATTKIQSENLIRVYGVEARRIILVPVQLNLSPSLDVPKKLTNHLSIGILGRIHKDRGLQKALEIINDIMKSAPDVTVQVAGDGPDLAWFKEELEMICPSQKVNFLGFLEGEHLEFFWANCGVLLSTAPAESYGRAMRESLVRRIPVLATVSTGSMELRSETSGSGIVLIEDSDSPSEVSQKFELARNMQISDEVISEVTSKNAEIPLKLAQSWIRLTYENS
jgi:glycosyltransferase involved in cell wall biosynthesis